MAVNHPESSWKIRPPDNFLYVFKTGPDGPERARRTRTPVEPPSASRSAPAPGGGLGGRGSQEGGRVGSDDENVSPDQRPAWAASGTDYALVQLTCRLTLRCGGSPSSRRP